MDIPTFDDVVDAHARIAPYIHRTPVLTSSYLNQLTGAGIFFKCENLQKVGAFKAGENEVIDAMYLTWERMKIIIEPSSTVPLAVILKNRSLFEGLRVGVVITSGNVDLRHCPGCE